MTVLLAEEDLPEALEARVPVMAAVAPKLLTADAAVALMHSVLVPGWMTVGAA